jgi:hypothetical protein
MDIIRMEEIKAARHNLGLIYRSFAVTDAHTLSERHQSFKAVNLTISKFITWLI